MKRVLCILSCMNAGGAETFLMKVYRKLDKTKYQIDFCVNVEEKNFYEDEIVGCGGKMFRIPAKSQNVKEFKNKLSVVVRNGNYDSVLRITSSTMGFFDLKVAKEAGAKRCCARSSNSSDGKGIKPWLAHRAGKLLFGKYVDVGFAPSDLAAIYTFGKKAYNSGKVEILHNGVDLSCYKYEEQAAKKVREEFGIADNVKIIGHVGRFMEQKNHMFLIDVFSEIHKQDSNTVLMLVGKGELENKIREYISTLSLDDSVIFTGVRSDIPTLMSAMDVFVMPSFFEGMPNTVIEAQATGLPCVIADTITREADITGLVDYMSLSDSPQNWAKEALNKISDSRKNTYDDFVKNGYDIETVTNNFVRLVFGE